MKVLIPHTHSDSNQLNGKSLFCHRLGQELLRRGVDVTDNRRDKTDIALNVIRLQNTNARINVLRLNGVYHNSAQDYEKKNANIKLSLQRADAVIYQSYHAKKLCDTFIGKAYVPSTIIFNGADPEYYKQFEPIKSLKNNKVVLAFAKWRPHKRLHDIIESFLLAEVEDSILLIAGDITKSGVSSDQIDFYSPYSNIHFLGNLDQQQLGSYIKSADVTMHLCWFDACPNSVVESLCANVPVITNNVGGTRELLQETRSSVLVCHVDEPYDYKPVDLYNPPAIDRNIVADKIRQALEHLPRIDSTKLHISSTADKYIKFFENLLK